MELFYIGDAIESPLGFQQESILTQEPSVDDPSSEVFGFEMGVREANEDLLQRLLFKVLGEMSHRVGSNHTHIPILPLVLYSHRVDLLSHIVHQLVSDLEPEDQLLGKGFAQGE